MWGSLMHIWSRGGEVNLCRKVWKHSTPAGEEGAQGGGRSRITGRAREVPARRGGLCVDRLSFLHQLHTFCALVLVLFSLRHPGSKVQLLTGTHLKQTFPYSFRDHTGDAGRLGKGRVCNTQHPAIFHAFSFLRPFYSITPLLLHCCKQILPFIILKHLETNFGYHMPLRAQSFTPGQLKGFLPSDSSLKMELLWMKVFPSHNIINCAMIYLFM